MEQYWIIFAIITALCIGFYGFSQKMKAEMPEQSDNGFIFYSYLLMGLSGLIWPIFFGSSLNLMHVDTILYALWITIFYIIIVKTRLQSLRYLSSSTYFINYRIASSLWLVIAGISFFSETITLKECIGILIWFVVFYLLIEKKDAKESMSELKKWFGYLLIGSFAVTWVQGLAKSFALSNLDIFTLVFFQGVFWILFVLLLKWKESYKKVFHIQSRFQFFFLLISGIIFACATIMNNYALIGWDLAIVYKIISYSLFIPIILSIIIYKEQVGIKKMIAFVLTLISIFLFI